jgi:hypothetical protein
VTPLWLGVRAGQDGLWSTIRVKAGNVKTGGAGGGPRSYTTRLRVVPFRSVGFGTRIVICVKRTIIRYKAATQITRKSKDWGSSLGYARIFPSNANESSVYVFLSL